MIDQLPKFKRLTKILVNCLVNKFRFTALVHTYGVYLFVLCPLYMCMYVCICTSVFMCHCVSMHMYIYG